MGRLQRNEAATAKPEAPPDKSRTIANWRVEHGPILMSNKIPGMYGIRAAFHSDPLSPFAFS